MTRAEINVHPTVAPLLAAWRKARADRDRVVCDKRHGSEAQHATERAAREAERAYDRAVAALLLAR